MEDYLNKYDWVAPFNQGVAIVVKDNKYGAILTGGQEIIEPSYEYISSFKDGFAQAIKNGCCVMVDLSGSECKQSGNKIIRVPKEYDVVRDFKDGFACVQKDGKWGVIDTDCKEIIPPKFFYISDFVKGTAKYKKYDNSSWGFLNSDGFCSDCNLKKEPEIEADGTLIIERYEKTNEINKDKEVKRIIRIDNNGNIIVKNGNNDVIVSNEYHIARDFYCGVACVQNTDGCWGAINERGEVILPFDYFSIQDFECERSFACDKKRRLRLVSSTGSVFEEFDYSWYSYDCRPFWGDYAIIKKDNQCRSSYSFNREDEKYGVIDKSGQEILKIAYDRIKDIKEDHVVAEITDIGEFCFGLDGKSCIIDNQIIKIPDWCLGVQHIKRDIFSALSDGKEWGLINTNGETLCEPIFDKIGDVRDDIVVGESYSTGWSSGWGTILPSSYKITKYGFFIVASGVSKPAIYDTIPELEGNYYKVKQNGLYGYIGLNGEEVLKPEYKEIVCNKNSYYIVSKKVNDEGDIKQGLLNAHFETIFEPQYEEITIIRKGLYRICKLYSRPKKWTLFNDSGQISNSFDEMGSSVNKGLIRVSKYGKKGFINIDGSIVIHLDDNKPIELPAKFSWGEDFVNGIAAVWINGFPNYVDKNFNVIINNNGKVVKISTKLDYIISVHRDQNYTFVYQRKVGLLSKDGKLLVEPKYNYLSFYNDGLYLATIKVENKKSCGIIRTNGELIVPITYASITPFLGKAKKEEHLVWDQDEWIDITEELSDGAPKINEEDIKYWLITTDNEKYGLINMDAKVCLEAKYCDIVQVGNVFLVEDETQKNILDDHFKMKLHLADTYTKLESYDGRVHHKEYWEEKEKTDHTIPEPVIPEGSVKLELLYNNYGYGLIDDKGNLCIDTKYDNIVQYEHIYFVKKGELWGVVNHHFDVVIEPKFDSVEAFKYGFLTKKYGSFNDNNLGLIDKYGNEVLEPIYYRIWSSDSEGIIYFCKKENNGKLMYGVMNEKFDIIVQPEFSYISDFQNGRAYANNQINEPSRLEPVFQCGYLNTEGKFSDFIDLIDVKNGYYPDRIKVIGATGEGLTIIQIIDSNPNNQYCAIINSESKVILPFMYHSIKPSNGGTYKVMIRKKNINSFSDTEKWYLLDGKFNLLFSEACSSISEINNRFIVCPAYDKVGLIDYHGNTLLPCEYSSIEEAGNGLLWIAKNWNHTHYGLATIDGKVLINCKYGRTSSFVDDRAIVDCGGWREECIDYDKEEYRSYYSPGPFGVIDIYGNEIIAPTCEEITYKKRYKHFLVTKSINKEIKNGRFSIDGYQIIKDTRGKNIIVSKKYDWYDDFDKNSCSVVYSNGEKGLVNSKSQMVFHLNSNDEDKVFYLPEEFDWGYLKTNDYFIVEKNEKKGVLKTDYTLIIDCLYDEIRLITLYSDCLFLCGNIKEKDPYKSSYSDDDYLWTIINQDGIPVIDGRYNRVEIVTENDNNIFLCGELKESESYKYSHPSDDYLWSIIDKDYKQIFAKSMSFSDFKLLGNSLIAVKGNDGKFMIYDFFGRSVTKEHYDIVFKFSAHSYVEKYGHSEGYDNDGVFAIVGIDDKYGAINRYGEEVVPLKYKSLSIKEHNQIVADGVLMSISGHPIIADDNSALPIPGEYEGEQICSNGLIIVKKDNLYGCITQANTIVIPIIYSKLECHGFYFIASICIDEEDSGYYDNEYRDEDGHLYKTGVISHLNEEIIPFDKVYQEFVICDTFIKYRSKDYRSLMWGAFTLQGEKICDPKYHQIDYFSNIFIKVGEYRYSPENYNRDGYFYYEDENPGNSGIDWGLIDFKGNVVLPLEYDKIGNVIETGRILVYHRLEKGFIDVLGNLLLAPIYYSIDPFVDGFAIVSKQFFNREECEDYFRFGVIDSSYKEVIPCVFSSVQYEKELGLFKTEKGYKTLSGKSIVEHDDKTILINEKYAFCSEFNNGCAIATSFVKGKRYGLINTKSEDILPPIFQSLQYMDFGLLAYKLNGKWGVVNCNGNIVLPNQYDGICEFDGKLAMIKINNSVTNKRETDSTLLGYINSEGRTVLPAEFSFIGKRNGEISVIRNGMDGTWGLFNREKQEFKMIENSAYIGPCKNGLCIINAGGHFDRVKKKTDGGKWGYIFADGRDALSPVYDYVGIRSNNYSVIRKDKTWGLFNLTTYEVKMIKNASYLGPYKEGLCLINIGGDYDPKKKKADGGKWGFINIEGTPVLPVEYDFVGKRNENFSVIRKDLNWGLFNLVTHEVKTFENASCLGPCNNGLCRINVGGTYSLETKKISGGKWGYLAPDKGIVIATKYSDAHSFSDSMAAVKMNDKWGFINIKGDLIVPCEYDEVYSSFSKGKGELLKNNYIYVFDKEGKNLSSRYRDDDDDDYDDYYGYDDYDTPTYDKYGGPGGYSDQTIDDAFDGDPDLLWNID